MRRHGSDMLAEGSYDDLETSEPTHDGGYPKNSTATKLCKITGDKKNYDEFKRRVVAEAFATRDISDWSEVELDDVALGSLVNGWDTFTPDQKKRIKLTYLKRQQDASKGGVTKALHISML